MKKSIDNNLKMERSVLLRSILIIAIPSIVTNITTPLLGMTDVAIAGHMGDSLYIGAIAVGSNMFNMIYWLFGFLRMGSSGLTAQLYGAGQTEKARLVLSRALLIAFAFGTAFIVLSVPLRNLLMNLMEVEAQTREFVSSYFDILIWGAPAFLGSFALTGWLLGMQNSKTPMFISILIDSVNIIASIVFVYAFSLQIRGLAIGTLVAQWVGFVSCLVVICRKYRVKLIHPISLLLNRDILLFFKINLHIFLRTVLLVAVTLWFTRVGSMLGNDILAVNALILQLFTFFSFFMDGFAYAGEAVCGKYKGARDRKMFMSAIKLLLKISFVLALIFTFLYFVAGDKFVSLLCSDSAVISLSKEYIFWAVTIPLAGFMAFSYDGVFIGATETYSMLLSMFGATVVFFGVYFLTEPSLGNHGLWLAFISYLLMRGIVLLFLSRKFYKSEYFKDSAI